MLTWVNEGQEISSESSDTAIRRIGFAMGSAGECSRILTTAFGGAVTYTSVVGEADFTRKAVAELNDNYQKNGDNTIAIPFPEATATDLEPFKAQLRISKIYTH